MTNRYLLAALCLIPGLASAQVVAPVYKDFQGNIYTATGTICLTSAGTECSFGGAKQEAYQLVSANTAAAAGTMFGGDYIFAQTCSGYGTVHLQVLGPDNTTYTTILSKTSADSAGGTGVALGSNAVVKVTLSGTTGCNAILSRVP